MSTTTNTNPSAGIDLPQLLRDAGISEVKLAMILAGRSVPMHPSDIRAIINQAVLAARAAA